MKAWHRVALIFVGFAVAVLFPFVFNWEGKGRFWSVLLSLIVIAAASLAGTANFVNDNDGKFVYRPRGVEVYIAAMIFAIGVIMLFTHIAQW